MTTPWFFISYARAGAADTHVLQFADKLAEEMGALSGAVRRLTAAEIGFVDRKGIENGEIWETVLADKLAKCRVLVCLYSDGYFGSEFCGKEFWAFRSRFPSHEEALAQVVPVLWQGLGTLPPRLPRAVRPLHYEDDDFSDEYVEKGLYRIKTAGNERDYIHNVQTLAGQILERGRREGLPEAACLTPFNAIPNAWDEKDERPAAPSKLQAAAASHRRITLKWKRNSDDEEGFEVVRCEGADCKEFKPVCPPLPARTERYEDTGLAPETTYCYRVRAFNAGGPSEFSTEKACARTPPPPPPIPWVLYACIAAAGVLLAAAFIFQCSIVPSTCVTPPTPTPPPPPPPTPTPFVDLFQAKSPGDAGGGKWAAADSWAVPDKWGILGNSRLANWLVVKGTQPGVVKDMKPGNLIVRFGVQYAAGNRAGWTLHAPPDGQGFGGYCFKLERVAQGSPFTFGAYDCRSGESLPVNTNEVGITQYGKQGDFIQVEAIMENDRIRLFFRLKNEQEDGASNTARGNVTQCYSAVVTVNPASHPEGSVGLFAGDDETEFRVRKFEVYPLTDKYLELVQCLKN